MKIIYFILLALLFTGCELFETRDPEEPNSPRSDFVTPTQPSILFLNLSNSLKQKVVENYLQCFVDESFLQEKYRFIPSAGSINQFTVLLDWDLDAERQYFNNLKSQTRDDSQIILELDNEISNTSADSAVYQYEYFLTVPILDKDPVVYSGNMLFTIKLDTRSNWVITRWEDLNKENFPSWSELKGQYY